MRTAERFYLISTSAALRESSALLCGKKLLEYSDVSISPVLFGFSHNIS